MDKTHPYISPMHIHTAAPFGREGREMQKERWTFCNFYETDWNYSLRAEVYSCCSRFCFNRRLSKHELLAVSSEWHHCGKVLGAVKLVSQWGIFHLVKAGWAVFKNKNVSHHMRGGERAEGEEKRGGKESPYQRRQKPCCLLNTVT